MKIESKQRKQQFDMLQTLLQMSDDPEFKKQMLKEMAQIALAKNPTFKSINDTMYVDLTTTGDVDMATGDVDLTTTGDDDVESIVVISDEETDDAEHRERVRSIIADVVEQSDYVIIDDVIVAPEVYEDENWWTNLCVDLKILYGTNNLVTIFNDETGRNQDGRRSTLLFSNFKVETRFPPNKPKPDSPPEVMERVKNFLQPWYDAMLRKLKNLKLIEHPRYAREPILLVSQPGCKKQVWHWDFDPAKVQALMKEGKLEGVPLSCLCSFTPDGSSLEMLQKDGTCKHIDIPFGAMIIFTGDCIHSGSQYDDVNFRGFFHVHHETLCPYNEDTVYLQTVATRVSANAASSASATAASSSSDTAKKRLGSRSRKSTRLTRPTSKAQAQDNNKRPRNK